MPRTTRTVRPSPPTMDLELPPARSATVNQPRPRPISHLPATPPTAHARGTGPWSFGNDSIDPLSSASQLELTGAGSSSSLGILRTGTTTNFSGGLTTAGDAPSLLAKNSFAISGGTQNFDGAASLTA